MRIIFCAIISIIAITIAFSQDKNSLNTYLIPKEAKRDKDLVHHLLDSSNKYAWVKPELGLAYSNDALAVSQELNYNEGIAMSYIAISANLRQMGDYAGSMDLAFRALNIFKRENNINGIGFAQYSLGGVYKDQGDYEHAIEYFKTSNNTTYIMDVDSTIHIMHLRLSLKQYRAFYSIEMADCYIESGRDSAIVYARESFSDLSKNGDWQFPFYIMGKTHMSLQNYDSALYYYQAGLNYTGTQNPTDISKIRIGIAKTFQKMGMLDSTIVHANQAIEVAYNMSYLRGVNEASEILAYAYEKINPAKSIQYYKLNKITGDSLFNQQKTRDIQSFAFRQQLEDREIQQRLAETEIQYKNRLNIYILSGGLSILLIVSLGLWRRSVFKQKALTLVNKQKQEIENQKVKVEDALQTLQTTQYQLVQSEKMASLGELTAGIAHEIQNPLNFVNNFSEVNEELLIEMKDELDKGNVEDAKAIAGDAIENQQKILHHGKRADAIVKGMLQHSRTSSGQKELTDINTLCDEYLRLAYHGLRAKDKAFNAKFETNFDSTLPKLNVVPQDIGRVILNLISNAFYAVNERANLSTGQAGNQQLTTTNQPYEPTVTVSTKKLSEKIEIRVKDNGNGIPDHIKEKIFQPFFTTKPTGQGTGLGLSLSYDIVKAHGGEIKMQSEIGEGTEFSIQLPNE